MDILEIRNITKQLLRDGKPSVEKLEQALPYCKELYEVFGNTNDLWDVHQYANCLKQLGNLDEVLIMCGVDERFIPCIDFGHLNARTHGGLETYEDFETVLNSIENALGADRLKVYHSHFSKIQYTDGGEKCHLTFEDEQYGPDFDFLAELIYKKGLTPITVCESAGTQAEDALVMKKMYLEQKI